MTHILGRGRNALLSVHTSEWLILNCFYAPLTWCVPIYVMISGRFFLDEKRNLTLHQLFFKYIKRLILAFIVWTLVYQFYALAQCLYRGHTYLNIWGIIYESIIGEYHLWYIYMQIGLYLLTPLIKNLAESKQLTEYYLILFISFSFLESYGKHLPGIGGAITTILAKSEIHFVLGYAGYYLLGYYLYKYPLSVQWEKLLYIAGSLMLIFSCISTTLYSKHLGTDTSWFVEYLTPSTIIEAAALFTFFTKRVSKISFSEKTIRYFSKLTELSFGAYLVHALVQKVIFSTGLTPNDHPLIMVPLLTILVFIISIFITSLIRKIPKIGKIVT
jgi:surface polysaccharide O-acyltransferase-like enzyme